MSMVPWPVRTMTSVSGQRFLICGRRSRPSASGRRTSSRILLDVRLPDANGLDLLPQIKKRWPGTEIIVLTGHGTMDMAVEATKRGAYNFLSKPFENEKLLADVKCAVERSYLDWAFEEMGGPVFRSSSMNDV